MTPLNHILRKCAAGYKLKSQEKINHLMYMDGIKLFAKNEKELETLIRAVRIYSQDRNGIWHRKMCYACNEKWQMTWLTEWNYQIKIRLVCLEGKETYKYLGILEADNIKQVEMKDKIQKEYLWRTKKLRDKTL